MSMPNKSIQYSIQELKNFSADHSVSPPIPREAWLGKDGSGNYRVIKVLSTGAIIINTS
jgi:hypothetical protein